MASVKVSTQNLKASIAGRFNTALKDPRFLREIAEVAITNSVAESRLGRDPKTGKNYEPFGGENREKYIARRALIARDVGRGANFRPSRSNLTLSGQLLLSNSFKISGNKIIFTNIGNHRPYTSNGKIITNKKLAEWHTTGAGAYPARRVFGINQKTMNILRNMTAQQVRRIVTSGRR